MARKTTEEFIAEATAKHNGRYSYELADYKKSAKKVTVTCKEHGSFDVTPNNHLNGSNCPACKKIEMSKFFRKDNATFIKQAKAVHGDKYNYTNTRYTTNMEDVTVTCPVHGDFKQSPKHHLNGHGCSKCSYPLAGLARATGKEGFIEKARVVHGDAYEYDDVVYVNSFGKVSISCKKHGSFSTGVQSHLLGQGCPACLNESSQEEFISKAKEVHGDKYAYSEVVYSGVLQHVKVICREHGPFLQIPYVHLRGSGCGSCAVTGFDCGRSGTLYVMVCGNMTKVGITNKPAALRASRIGGSYGSKFTVTKEVKFQIGRDCHNMETSLLRKLRSAYSNPASKFDGSTETFLDVDRQWLYAQIEILGVEFA